MYILKNLILASNSPRRTEILKKAGFNFQKIVRETDEIVNLGTPIAGIAEELALKKAQEFKDFNENTIILTADTIVVYQELIMNKPNSQIEAAHMLKTLSGQTHTVFTGVCIKIGNRYQSFTDSAQVAFGEMEDNEIEFYIQKYKPMDKAGSYGIQDFMGMVKIHKIEGSFYTIMGMPVHLVYNYLKPYIAFH